MSELPESDRLGEFPHPRETARLFGQEEAERVLFDAFMGGRMHHAWLLTGPRGIGKATLAYRLARFILRYGAPESAAAAGARDLSLDETDQIFRQIAAQSHPNLLVIRRPYDEKNKRFKTVTTVEEVRRTSAFFGMSAGAGGWRVAIVDAADDMNVNAENALLKILEEPPANGLFILVSHQPGRLLPTIRSRCRTLNLKPLASADLARVLAANGAKVADEGEREAIARLAEGSAGRALSIAAGGGLGLYSELAAILKALPRLDIPAVHKLADKAARRGADETYETLIELLGVWLQRLVHIGAGCPPGGDIVPGEAAAMARLAGRGLDRWVEVWEKINQSAARAEALNTDRKLVILNAFSMLEEVAS